jgi:hypothetical protein
MMMSTPHQNGKNGRNGKTAEMKTWGIAQFPCASSMVQVVRASVKKSVSLRQDSLGKEEGMHEATRKLFMETLRVDNPAR